MRVARPQKDACVGHAVELLVAGEVQRIELRRCPQAVFVRPRHRLYREYSQAVWAAVREVVPTVERTCLDEGYLDMCEIAGDLLDAFGEIGGDGETVRGVWFIPPEADLPAIVDVAPPDGPGEADEPAGR